MFYINEIKNKKIFRRKCEQVIFFKRMFFLCRKIFPLSTFLSSRISRISTFLSSRISRINNIPSKKHGGKCCYSIMEKSSNTHLISYCQAWEFDQLLFRSKSLILNSDRERIALVALYKKLSEQIALVAL